MNDDAPDRWIYWYEKWRTVTPSLEKIRPTASIFLPGNPWKYKRQEKSKVDEFA